MYVIITLLLALLLIPWRISFEIFYEGISIFHLFLPWHTLKRTSKKVTKHTSQKSNRSIRPILKGIHLKRLNLSLGFQCEMIDDSLYLYSLGLLIFPTLAALCMKKGIQTKIRLQYFPVLKSKVSGMIELSLVTIILEAIRRH